MNERKPEDECTTCSHARTLHEPRCTMWFCGCAAFSERRDPSPPDERGWDDSDDSGNPGAT